MNATELFDFVTRNDSDLSGLTDTERDKWIEIAAEDLDHDTYGSKFSRAAAFLAAHMAKQFEAGNTDEVGAITDKSAGDVSISRSRAKAEDQYDNTKYGKRFKAVRDKRVGGPHSYS